MKSLALILLISLACTISSAAPPTPADVRAAVQRSLPYIEKGGTEWMKDRNCNSCHTVTFMVWSHSEAAERGLDVDRTKLAEWTKWSLADSLSDRRWFKLRPGSIDALKKAGLPAALLAKLKPLVGKSHTTEAKYVEALTTALGDEALARHRDALVNQARLPNDGGGPDTLGQLLLARPARPEKDANAADYAAIQSLLLEWQEADGLWQAAGQLPSLKCGAPAEMHEATTLWSLLAVARAGDTDKSAAASRQRALDKLKAATPGKTLQSLALHTIVAHDLGEPAQTELLSKQLLARQNPDGGWGWLKDNKTSDAFSTGQALYALARVGRDGTDPAVLKAWEFLLATQSPDGGWHVPQEAINTRPRKLNVYPYWGTTWAAIGLLQTLPKPANGS